MKWCITIILILSLIVLGFKLNQNNELVNFLKTPKEYNIYHVSYQYQETNSSTSFSVNSCDVAVNWTNRANTISNIIYIELIHKYPALVDKTVVLTSITYLGRVRD